ncbi:hypothetical protein IW261DRAFT_1421818 [Armillaria novae-zelandiae]|uniref:Uncharacterized protein n=1 Tax=Armillaria novae-zelandiae TaxID=153914 RepID=A0AA39UB94_9AGAR|nr:hypothetical protein IW261DRAFT_1421818 [Armillaria novae-zelandiae]
MRGITGAEVQTLWLVGRGFSGLHRFKSCESTISWKLEHNPPTNLSVFVSVHLDSSSVDDFRKAATLLDPLVQSGDPAISEGLQCADRLKNNIDMLYTILLNHIKERDSVIKGLADGLDAIAVCEGGTTIINQYAEAYELIRSLIVDVGKYGDASGV